jgi:hypothetical protein
VFFAAFLAEAAGIEPIIGAFFAGLALNKLIPHSSALMNRIEFIGNSLFIPFFLISVGMLVDVSVLLKGPTAIIVIVTLSVVALFGKWVAAFFTQLIFRYSKAQRQLIFGLSSSHAAATLAVILVGYKANILDENILNGTIILILITCLVSSFVTEKAAKKIVVESENDSSDLVKSNGIRSEHILLPIANFSNIEKLLEFAVLIKDKKSANPVSILSVVSDNKEAEINILKARNELEKFVIEGSASETKVDVITTIDHNFASGIVRISREIMADIVILGWPKRAGFIEKLIGEKFRGILSNTDKTTFICSLEKPLVSHKRILVAAPPLAEHEKGFDIWLKKIAKFAIELSVPIVVFCDKATENAVRKSVKKAKLNASITINQFVDWEDFLVLSRHIHEDDLFILVSARKGATSYIGALEQLPTKIEKYFATNNRIIVYPQRLANDVTTQHYADITSEPLNKGFDAVQKIGKGIGSLFKNKKDY